MLTLGYTILAFLTTIMLYSLIQGYLMNPLYSTTEGALGIAYVWFLNACICVSVMLIIKFVYSAPSNRIINGKLFKNNDPKFMKDWHYWAVTIGGTIALAMALMTLALVNARLGNHGSPSGAQASATGFLKSNLTTRGNFVLMTVLLAPVMEELIFRGILTSGLNQSLNRLGSGHNDRNWPVTVNPNARRLLAVMAANCLFALFHSPSNLIYLLAYLTMGYWFSYISIRYRSLWASTIAHSLWNGTAVILALVGV